jgi:hypothetical protein
VIACVRILYHLGMSDALLRLSFGIYSGRGLYAVMLGSGVSRPASIPTGWEVMLDLVRKVAAVQGEDPEPDPGGWYEKKFGAPADYTGILDTLTSTAAERGQLLRAYFEPTQEERERGEKQPTRAHVAIAQLVRDEFVNVVVTTNFDRLMEQALITEGVQPTVISCVDDIAGVPPLSHVRALVVKVHGDYLDARLRNTRDELAEYEPQMTELLTRIFCDYGLIIAGWSGAYDSALRELLEKSPNARYGTYWAAHGSLHEAARGILKARNAEVIPVRDADGFFYTLEEQVRALERMSGGAVLTAAVAANRVKAYVVDERRRIDLHDLAQNEVEALITHLGTERFPVAYPNAPSPDKEGFLGRLDEYEALAENALGIIATGARWGGPEHVGVWTMMIDRMLNYGMHSGGLVVWLNLQRYPALLLLYGAGVAAVAGGRDEILIDLLTAPERRDTSGAEPAYTALLADKVIDYGLMKKAYRHSQEQSFKTPVSQYLFTRLREPLRPVLPDDRLYERYFDRFEYLTALIQAHRTAPKRPLGWFHVGCFAWRADVHGDRSIQRRIAMELDRDADAWPLLSAGEFDGNLERLCEIKGYVDQTSR